MTPIRPQRPKIGEKVWSLLYYYYLVYSGEVKFYKTKTKDKPGFGYIARTDEKDDIYFNVAAVDGPPQQYSQVSFDVIQDGNMVKAINIRPIADDESVDMSDF